MVIKIPFDEEKTDVQLSFERYNKSLSNEVWIFWLIILHLVL